MKKLGMRIDFSTENVYVANNIISVSVSNTIGTKSLGTGEEEPGQLTGSSPITANISNALTLNSNESICNVVTVSYTHLDVYKRQVFISFCNSLFLFLKIRSFLFL